MNPSLYKLPPDLADDIESYALDVEKFMSGDLPAGILKAKRVPRGVYEQRSDGSYMVRIRVAGGVLSAQQADLLAQLAQTFGNGKLHATTRLDLQLHDIRIEDTPEIMRRLMVVGLTSKGGGGNTVRNVAACPYAGVCAAEPFDVTPFALAVTEYLIPLVGSYNLPRKYKIAFSGCDADCSLARVNDLGFIARVKDGAPGFSVYVGGGMGARSRPADLLEDWVPVKDVLRIAEAVRRLFDQHGDRKNRSRARLRFVLERLGLETFRNAFHDMLRILEDEKVPDCSVQAALNREAPALRASKAPEEESDSGLRLLRQRQDGFLTVIQNLPLGFISANDLSAIGRVAERFSLEHGVRVTRQQNLAIRFVKVDDRAALKGALQVLSPDLLPHHALHAFSCCAGASTCRLGLCLSRGLAQACADAWEKQWPDGNLWSDFPVHISGCPNACGQHPFAAVGLFGAARREGNRLAPAYRVVLGGRNDTDMARPAVPVGTVPARRAPAYLTELLRDFVDHRTEGERFVVYFERKGLAHFEQLTHPYTALPDAASAPEVYRDWGQNEAFSLAGRGAGECGSGVFEVIASDLATAEKLWMAQTDEAFSQELFDVLLPSARALLITRGIDSRFPEDVLRAFEEQFVNAGLVDRCHGELLQCGHAFIKGKQDALDGHRRNVRVLLDRVQVLFSTLDANLVFHPPDKPETVPASPAEEPRPPALEPFDLRGVACPMNFVKAKLKLESMSTDDTLTVLLDDGPPIQNVPASFRNEGQEIVETSQVDDRHWCLRVKKKV